VNTAAITETKASVRFNCLTGLFPVSVKIPSPQSIRPVQLHTIDSKHPIPNNSARLETDIAQSARGLAALPPDLAGTPLLSDPHLILASDYCGAFGLSDADELRALVTNV
jgi:hypothetical protein